MVVTVQASQSRLVDQLFKDMAALGIFHASNEIPLQCIRFCFLPILQGELNDTVYYGTIITFELLRMANAFLADRKCSIIRQQHQDEGAASLLLTAPM